ncbi:MAG: helix-turn-helix transcriptional regulator [Halobacteriaceae archaeon]
MNNSVRERREAEGLSQADLAAAVGVSRQTINAIERDRYDPSLELAFALAEHFDTDVESLFDPAGPNP